MAVAAAAYVASTTPVAGSLILEPAHGTQLVIRTALATVFAAGLLLPLVLGRSSTYSLALSHPTTRWLGLVSYGLFLWHLPVFEGLYALTGAPFFRGGMLPLLAVGVPVSLALAFLSYRLVEVPCSRLAARLAAGKRRQRESERHDEDQPDTALEPLRPGPTGRDDGVGDPSRDDERRREDHANAAGKATAEDRAQADGEDADAARQHSSDGEAPNERGARRPSR